MSRTDEAPRPPGPPWQALKTDDPPTGYLSFYYPDDLSPLPVRGVTKEGDNKSDPNIETGTYGVFSTCEQRMRAGVVKHGRPYLFFITGEGPSRALVGYYEVGWYAPGARVHGYGPRSGTDYMLAAHKMKFIAPGILLSEVAAATGDIWFAAKFRAFKTLDDKRTAMLLSLLGEKKDRTQEFIDEVRRLENVNFRVSKLRYINMGRKAGFDWQEAKLYMVPGTSAGEAPTRRATTGGPTRWKCHGCAKRFHSGALLKRCPYCGAFGLIIRA